MIRSRRRRCGSPTVGIGFTASLRVPVAADPSSMTLSGIVKRSMVATGNALARSTSSLGVGSGLLTVSPTPAGSLHEMVPLSTKAG